MTFFGVLIWILVGSVCFILGYFLGKADFKDTHRPKPVGDLVMQELDDGSNDLYLIIDDYDSLEKEEFVVMRMVKKASQESQAI